MQLFVQDKRLVQIRSKNINNKRTTITNILLKIKIKIF